MAADPMYRQIAEDLRRQIEDGGLFPGQQLRTELELREKYNASRNTVRDAIKWLIVVERVALFVTTLTGNPEIAAGGEGDTYIQEVTARLRQPRDTPPEVAIREVSVEIAELQLPDGSSVISRHQQRFIDGTPWSLQTSFYPMGLVERGALRLIQADNIDGGTVAYLREVIGVQQAGYRDTIRVRPPDEIEAAFFRLPDDGRVSVIETRRTAVDHQGSPVRLTVSVYPADRNQFAINVGRLPAEMITGTPSTTAGPEESD
jgi:GntR family transcriptional regulator